MSSVDVSYERHADNTQLVDIMPNAWLQSDLRKFKPPGYKTFF